MTLAEAEPWAAEKRRDILFREAVLAALGVRDRADVADEYCAACRAAGKANDCGTCDRRIEVVGNER